MYNNRQEVKPTLFTLPAQCGSKCPTRLNSLPRVTDLEHGRAVTLFLHFTIRLQCFQLHYDVSHQILATILICLQSDRPLQPCLVFAFGPTPSLNPSPQAGAQSSCSASQRALPPPSLPSLACRQGSAKAPPSSSVH